MPLIPFLALTAFIFLAIVGGIVGILLEGRLTPTGGHNPATRDTMFPIVGWATLFAIYLLVEFVGAPNLTPEFRAQLSTLWKLPLNYAALATGWLIWRAARRIHAWWRGRERVVWRPVPYLSTLRFPILFLAAILSAANEWFNRGLSISVFLLASIVALLAFIQRPTSD